MSLPRVDSKCLLLSKINCHLLVPIGVGYVLTHTHTHSRRKQMCVCVCVCVCVCKSEKGRMLSLLYHVPLQVCTLFQNGSPPPPLRTALTPTGRLHLGPKRSLGVCVSVCVCCVYFHTVRPCI